MLRTGSTIKVDIRLELALLFGLLAALALSIYVWPAPIVRIALGPPCVLLLPGYTLTAALFPRRASLSNVERVILSFGASLAIVPLIGLLLNYTPWGIGLESVLISTGSFVLLCAGLAYYRRSRLPAEERFVISIDVDPSRWRSLGWGDRLLYVVLVLSMVAATGAFIYALARPKAGEWFTEFYLLDDGGLAGEYPSVVTPGEPITLTVGIINHEHAAVRYRIERKIGADTKQIAYLELEREETWEQAYTFNLTEPGEHNVAFLLYRNSDVEPYRSLYLWITVDEPPFNRSWRSP